MDIAGLLKRFVGKAQPSQEIVGHIVEGPTVVDDGSSPAVQVFRLDSRPELEFRQVVSSLAATRRRGDRVKVHCRLDGAGVAFVECVEKT